MVGPAPWVSRLLAELPHEVIVAHARNVPFIGDSSRKDDRVDRKANATILGLTESSYFDNSRASPSA